MNICILEIDIHICVLEINKYLGNGHFFVVFLIYLLLAKVLKTQGKAGLQGKKKEKQILSLIETL